MAENFQLHADAVCDGGDLDCGSGLLLIIFGIMLLTNRIGEMSALFPDFGIKF